jgi:large subunit ribosomal protein L13
MVAGFYIILEESIMTTYLTPVKETERKWFVVDAQSMVLGRLAAEIATRLRGKHKPNYSTFQDVGDFVVVVNAEKVRLTGRKLENKIYYHHSGYQGGIKDCTAQELLNKAPEEMILRAVRGMLPKNSLGRTQLKKLKVYAGEKHPHESQQPEELKF